MILMTQRRRKRREPRVYHLGSHFLVLFSLLATGINAHSFTDVRFVQEPVDTVATRDAPASLHCVVEATATTTSQPSTDANSTPAPPVTIRWRKDGAFVDLEDNHVSVHSNGSLLFKSIRQTRAGFTDEGLYECLAVVGEVGTLVSRPAKLYIASIASFEEQPKNLSLLIGQTAYFPCSIASNTKAYVSWFKNGLPLEFDHTRMVQLPSGALEIDSVHHTDQASYQCQVAGHDRTRLSNPGHLFVLDNLDDNTRITAPVFIAQPSNVIALKGSSITLDCVANGNPRPTLTWLKEGSTIDMSLLDSRFRRVGVGSLQIDNVQESDDGSFMCRAQNSEDALDASATVTVQVAPRIVRSPVNKLAQMKEDVELECEAQGKPEPRVEWFKNGEKLIPSGYFQLVNGNNLKILGSVLNDRGFYQCMATNPAGIAQAAAQLIVLDKEEMAAHHDHPDAPGAPRNLQPRLISTRFITLGWDPPEKNADGITAYAVFYKEFGSSRERVQNTTQYQLDEIIVQNLKPAVQYNFRVVAMNEHGLGTSSESIQVETHGDNMNLIGPPKNLTATALSPISILVSWQPPSDTFVQHYEVSYQEIGATEERKVTTHDTHFTLKGLKKFTEYAIWVAAVNHKGSGLSTEETTVRTFSDVPSDVPQNVTLEVVSPTNIIVRWQEPPAEAQNGVITGYKIRYKRKGHRGETLTTDGNRRLYSLTGLEKGATYSVKIAAMTVNGTGPATDWVTLDKTLMNDLDESRVPDNPSALRAKPSDRSIVIAWQPPRDSSVRVRGFTIGWGVGIPDVYTHVLEGKQHFYTIENLQPSQEYVLSLRAYNALGPSRPIYDTVKTLAEPAVDTAAPMLPPVGLKAVVLSPTTVVLAWSDSTLSHSGMVTDNRHYTVRYRATGAAKYRYVNSTQLNCLIDDLRPSTRYEFAVKKVKGRRESAFSMDVLNTTHEAAPSSPPRDVIVTSDPHDASAVHLNWAPPKQSNGRIATYVVFYTTDNTRKDLNWSMEAVDGESTSAVIRNLVLDATYYFKVQARNQKGNSPLSAEVMYDSGKRGVSENLPTFGGNFFTLIAIAAGSIALLTLCVLCIIWSRKKPSSRTKEGFAKNKQRDEKPPDLWIHHDRTELKSLDKGGRNSESRNSQDLSSSTTQEDQYNGTLEKKKSVYINSRNSTCESELPLLPQCSRHSIIRGTNFKPFNLPMDSSMGLPTQLSISGTSSPTASVSGVGSVGTPGGGSGPIMDGSSTLGRHSMYPRTHYNIPRAHVTLDGCPGNSGMSESCMASCTLPRNASAGAYESMQLPPMSNSGGGPPPHCTGGMIPSYTSALLAAAAASVVNSHDGTLRRNNAQTLANAANSGASLRSFSVPAPPNISAPGTPQPQTKHVVVRPQPTVMSSSSGTTNPYATYSGGDHVSLSGSPQRQGSVRQGPAQGPIKSRVIVQAPPGGGGTLRRGSHCQELGSPFGSEQLNQEMANLEGLMKDLNAITASEFEC